MLPEGVGRPGLHWKFDCGRWLSLRKGDRYMSYDLPCTDCYLIDPTTGWTNSDRGIQQTLATADVTCNTDWNEKHVGDIGEFLPTIRGF